MVVVAYGADDGVAWVGLTPFVMADGPLCDARTDVLRVATDGDTASYADSRGAGRVRNVWLTSRRRAYTRRLGRLWETTAAGLPTPHVRPGPSQPLFT
ncbi:hypothetical protein ASD08_17495 [Streptomyces sp. Root369]|nr:hypothetical protein ASD08_17495 [Streptomyces sp. Root369]